MTLRTDILLHEFSLSKTDEGNVLGELALGSTVLIQESRHYPDQLG